MVVYSASASSSLFNDRRFSARSIRNGTLSGECRSASRIPWMVFSFMLAPWIRIYRKSIQRHQRRKIRKNGRNSHGLDGGSLFFLDEVIFSSRMFKSVTDYCFHGIVIPDSEAL